jgi:predicted AAA+ superfamily ATPase
MERAQKAAIVRDLSKKMVFLTGPRQAGKTTLAKAIALGFSSSIYLNYDHSKDREILLKEGF